MWILVLVYHATWVWSDDVIVESYKERRDKLVSQEEARRLGNDIILDPYEKIVNEKLMEDKKKEMAKYQSGKEIFPLRESFTEMKKNIGKSKVFQFIRKMPKGEFSFILRERERERERGGERYTDLDIDRCLKRLR